MTIPGLRIRLESEVPVYRQIADGVRAALAGGRLRPGRRLPPTRDLARQLGVNRNTVVAAYDVLASEGLVHSHTGRGTFVADPPSGGPAAASVPGAATDAWMTTFSRAVESPSVDRLLALRGLAGSTGDGTSFATSFPACDLMPIESFGRAMAAVLGERGPDLLSYGFMAGSQGLRDWIASDMRRRGSHVSNDEVLVTNGSQQAIDLVFRTLLDPGDPVVLEDPTFTGALSSLGSLGARLIGVPVDGQGVIPDALAMALEHHRPKLIYLQPTIQNPSTHIMGESRRREVLALAARFGCAIVEDDWAGELVYEGEELPTLHAMDGGNRVLYVSTFSKKLMPGLRIGWVSAPPRVIERLVALKQIEDCGTSPLLQDALERFLRDGGLEAHLARVRPVYRERRDRMLDALDRSFPEGIHWTRPTGGLFLWVTLPDGLDSSELFVAARRKGVVFSRGDLFHVEGKGQRSLRLTFGSVPPERIDAGVALLGELIRQRLAEGPSRTSESPVEAIPIF